MTPDSEGSVQSAAAFSQRHAGLSLLPAQAKLYSQFTRVRAGSPGLSSWNDADTAERLGEALRLVQAALIQRGAQQPGWKSSLKRAAEILEWLGPSVQPEVVPTELLAAAAYQLAGYPACAAGLLRDTTERANYSRPLVKLLGSDFSAVLSALTDVWRENRATLKWGDNRSASSDQDIAVAFQELIVRETLGTLGIVTGFLRWGEGDRIEISRERLIAVVDLVFRGADPYSWVLARLLSEALDVITDSSLRRYVAPLASSLTGQGRGAIERYLRRSFATGRALAWPSQVRGIASLMKGGSFALCTPTGSGKTTIAELAIIQSLFSNEEEDPLQAESPGLSPIAMYMTPSRSLAAEVERKLDAVFQGLSSPRVIVTGLYGGIDWGPTDAWLTSEDRVVLICTYEKAEALLRFIGPLFIERLRLIVVDEAHSVQLQATERDLAQARSLSLESLLTRLLSYVQRGGRSRKMIALSAVAGGVEDVLAKWISGDPSALAVTEPYRSTRQLIGRLELSPNRVFEIRYDLLDRSPLMFREGSPTDTPYIPRPIPALPQAGAWDSGGPEKSLRPALLWAALHFAAPDSSGHRRSVLVYLPQRPEHVAKDFLEILTLWADQRLPVRFQPPQSGRDRELWNLCLACCSDYFGGASNEYQLLQRGLVLHHGRMPGMMSRLLIQVIERRIVNVVVATSTLAEGVNLPFETVLIGSLRRSGQPIPVGELANVIGRAGRPGYGTEGRALVILGQGARYRLDRRAYNQLIAALQHAVATPTPARSALAALLRSIESGWRAISGDTNPAMFDSWLEQIAVADVSALDNGPAKNLAAELDALDKTLLAAIIELEALDTDAGSPADLEERLSELWGRSFAHYASVEEARLGNSFVRRGVALESTIYPDGQQRQRLYMSSVPPAAGSVLVDSFQRTKTMFASGSVYAEMTAQAKFDFIRTAVERFGSMTVFRLSEPPGSVAWEGILAWWLRAPGAPQPLSPIDASRWYQYVSNNFLWRFTWGLGSFIALAVNEAHDGVLRATEMQEWPATGLPWVVFWLKEIINWGTLDPVASYLLSRQVSTTRSEAEVLAATYYMDPIIGSLPPDNRLEASRVRDWAMGVRPIATSPIAPRPLPQIEAELLRDFGKQTRNRWRVIPVESDLALTWCDVAGFPLATSSRPVDWNTEFTKTADFILDSVQKTVRMSSYLTDVDVEVDTQSL